MVLVRRLPGRSPAAALLALLAAGWLAPAAGAGCVHDALRRAQEPTGSAHFRWLIAAGAMEAPTEAAPGARPDAGRSPADPGPCDGPSCSRGQETPATPPTATTPLVRSWAWDGRDPFRPAPSTEPLPIPDARPCAPSRDPSIFHPPRPALAP